MELLGVTGSDMTAPSLDIQLHDLRNGLRRNPFAAATMGSRGSSPRGAPAMRAKRRAAGFSWAQRFSSLL